MTRSPPDSVVVGRIQRAFPPDELREYARATNLVQRERKSDTVALLCTLSLGFAAGSDRSLQAFLERYVEMADRGKLSYASFHDWFEPGSIHHKACQLRRLLTGDTSRQPQQADDETHEDQLLNSLISSLDEEVVLSFAKNAELDAEDIYEVLVGACADGTSVSTLCKGSEGAPHENSILYHLRTKFDLETPEQVGSTPLQKDILNVFPQQVEVCADLPLRPYYGDEDDIDGLYHSQAKCGATVFRAYATLHVRVKNKRYTLTVRRLENGDTASSVLVEPLGILDSLDLSAKVVYPDREFYDSKCLMLLQAHSHAYVMPAVRRGRTIKRELSEGWSCVIQHSLAAGLDDHSWIVEFLVYIDCTYQNGWYDEHEVARHGYVVDAPSINSP